MTTLIEGEHMYSFKNDYSEGAHPKVLERLIESNLEQSSGYGLDPYTKGSIDKIKDAIGNHDVDIHLISGGTQTNLIAISSFLRPHEACIAAETGHIAVHETGAIEQTGHKVITVASDDGKLSTDKIENVLLAHHDEHLVKPKLVYISNATEVGTVYTKQELEILYRYCQEKDLYLYIDGARLGAAVATDLVNLKSICDYSDAFFIGGTKNGALLGEALVIKREVLKSDFRYLIKQKGGLLAKGRVLGIQFETLFTDDLLLELGRYANRLASKMQSAFIDKGYDVLTVSQTNQIFPVIDTQTLEKLQEHFEFYVWQSLDDKKQAIRLVTSWATDESQVDRLISLL